MMMGAFHHLLSGLQDDAIEASIANALDCPCVKDVREGEGQRGQKPMSMMP